MKQPILFLSRLWLLLMLPAAVVQAEQFGNIVVSPQSTVMGATDHGYRELRVHIQNRSPREPADVTLIFPAEHYGRGNTIRSIRRSVRLAPGAMAVVPLWQPPLPANGNNQLRVLINGQVAGTVAFPSAPQHASSGTYHHGGRGANVLVSRTLNFDEVNRLLKPASGSGAAYSADAATGAPNASGSHGVTAMAWTPEVSRPGPHWIELTYSTPVQTDRVRIYETGGWTHGGTAELIGSSGTNLASVPIPAAVRSGRTSISDITLPLTTEPVKTVRLNMGTIYSGYISVDAVELSGPSGSSWASSAIASSEGTSSYGGKSETLNFLRSEAPIPDWSEQWLSYSPFDSIVVGVADLNQMRPGVVDALWRYAEVGGNLLIIGGEPGHVPRTWQPSGDGPGFRRDRPIVVGFGKCFLLPGIPGNEHTNAIRNAITAVQDTARSWEGRMDEDSANAAFPVLQNVRLPVRGTVLAMLTFVLIIGPVNLIVLTRMKRRTWMLWTIPAISLGTCLVVFTYTLFREGVTPDVRIEGLTLLDQENRRATSMGMTAFYCPLTPGGGLMFSPDTEATPLVNMDWNTSGARRDIDWTVGQHLQRGWVTARVPAYFDLRKSEARRERLQLERSDGALIALNGLGAPVRNLWLADASGQIHSAKNIGPGEKATLAPFEPFPNVIGEPAFPGRHMGVTGNALTNMISPHPGALLRRGTYVAELETNPFLENGLRNAKARVRTQTIVYGILEP